MKLKFSCYTIFIIIISVDCGLVKNFFGNVKKDVHTAVDNTVNIIGKGTHKITEGLGVFLHRNEGNKFPGHQSGTVRPNNQLPNGNNIDNSNNYYNPTNNKREENTDTGNNENHSQYYKSEQTTKVNEYNEFTEHQPVTPTNQISKDDKIDNTNGLTDNTLEENSIANNENNSNYYSPVKSTPATVEHTSVNGNVHDTQNGAYNDPTTEIIINKNEEQGTTTNKVQQPEATSKKNIHEYTTESTTKTTNIATTTEADPWLNGVELENILPIITHNDTHFAGKNTINSDTGSYTDTNELGTGENLPNITYEETNNKTAKCDDSKKPADSETNGNKANLISDQMFFKDNQPKPTKSTHYICAKPLVRAANGDCLEPIEIDVRKKNEPRVYNIFQADGCASGYARAQDNTCQKVIG